MRSIPTFRLKSKGVAKALGDLEAEIMELVWAGEDAVPARVVADQIARKRDVQHITVVTVLNNLCQKKLLKRRREGRAYLYSPLVSRDEFLEEISRSVLSSVLRLGPAIAVSSFVDVLVDLAPEEIARLKTLLDQIEGD